MKRLKNIVSLMHSILRKPDEFSCTFESKKLRLCLWERPGRWMNDRDLAKLQQDVLQVAAEAQEGKEVPEYGALVATRENYRDRIITVAYDPETGAPMAFSAQVYLDIDLAEKMYSLIHLGLAYVSPKFRRRNLSYAINVLPTLIIFLKKGARPFWISSVSQVPAVVGAVEYSFRSVYPHSRSQNAPSYLHSLFAKKIIEKHRDKFGVGADAWFDTEKHIIRNAYTGGSDHLKKPFEAAQKHRDEVINQMCKRELDYERGDDFLQIAVLDMRVFYELSMRKISNMGSQVVLQLFFAAIGVTLLPAIKWLTCQKAKNLSQIEEFSI